MRVLRPSKGVRDSASTPKLAGDRLGARSSEAVRWGEGVKGAGCGVRWVWG